MKRIKCKTCDGVWRVEKRDLHKQKVCPYCVAAIQGEGKFTEY